MPASPSRSWCASRERIGYLGAVHVLRTTNGGTVWDDMTVIYRMRVRASRRIEQVAQFMCDRSWRVYASANLETLGSAVSWTQLAGFPKHRGGRETDEGGHQLWAVIDGYGVYSTLAPNRMRDPRVVSAADFVARAAAPGSWSALQAPGSFGAGGNLPVAVLASTRYRIPDPDSV